MKKLVFEIEVPNVVYDIFLNQLNACNGNMGLGTSLIEILYEQRESREDKNTTWENKDNKELLMKLKSI